MPSGPPVCEKCRKVMAGQDGAWRCPCCGEPQGPSTKGLFDLGFDEQDLCDACVCAFSSETLLRDGPSPWGA